VLVGQKVREKTAAQPVYAYNCNKTPCDWLKNRKTATSTQIGLTQRNLHKSHKSLLDGSHENPEMVTGIEAD
jgi:hypothetical protein